MNHMAIVVLADTETLGDLGRVVNALEAVKEFKDANDEVQLIFDGAGTKWIGELSDPDHKYHGLYRSVQDKVSGACHYCANAFGVNNAVEAAHVPLLGDFEGHPSFRKLVSRGYQIITF